MDRDGEELEDIKLPIIVVSDLHIGNENSNYPDFQKFLKFLAALDGSGHIVEGKEIRICSPGTLVLLGDILELWDPQEDNRNYVMRDALSPLSIMGLLSCKVVYVIGNHDEDLLELRDILMTKRGKGHPLRKKIEIYFRTYPRRKKGEQEVEGIPIGSDRYVFLHGQQFDRTQIFYTLSKKLGTRVDPIDWFQDLANVSFTRQIGKDWWNVLINLMILLIFLIILLIFCLLCMIGLFKISVEDSYLICYRFLWIVVSSLLLITIIPRAVTRFNTKIWRSPLLNMVVKKCTPAKEVICSPGYKEKKGQKIKANIVVFGHTHAASWYYDDAKDKLFINTGCWVKECDPERQNTFLYITEEAPYLLRWDVDRVKCIKEFRRPFVSSPCPPKKRWFSSIL